MENENEEINSGEERETVQEREEKGGEGHAVNDDMKRVGDDDVTWWKKRMRA
jgi:hypothetical protein